MLNPNAHWRDSSRQPKFFFVSANAAYPIVLMLLHISWWTLIIAVSTILCLAILEYFGLTPMKFLRLARIFLVGRYKYRKGWWE